MKRQTLHANKIEIELLPQDGYEIKLTIHNDMVGTMEFWFRNNTEVDKFMMYYEQMNWTEVKREQVLR